MNEIKILTDTREKPQAIKNILAYFDRHGILWEKRKLDIGDYMMEGRPGLVIDRKQSLGELCVNMCSGDVSRFYREVRRAHDSGVRLIILCEACLYIVTVRRFIPAVISLGNYFNF